MDVMVGLGRMHGRCHERVFGRSHEGVLMERWVNCSKG